MALRRVAFNLSSKTTTAAVISTTQHHLRRNVTTKVNPEITAAIKDKCEYHGLIAKGTNAPFIFSPTVDGYVFRIDMPEIHNSDLRYTVAGPMISVSAQESEPHRFGSGQFEPRYYEAVFELDPVVYKADGLKAEVKNGVFWLKVPKISIGPGWVSINFGRVKTHIDRFGKVETFGIDQSDGTCKIHITGQ